MIGDCFLLIICWLSTAIIFRIVDMKFCTSAVINCGSFGLGYVRACRSRCIKIKKTLFFEMMKNLRRVNILKGIAKSSLILLNFWLR